MPQFAANLSLMYTELPFLDRFAAAARDRFTAVEFLFPYAFEPVEVAARLADNGLQLVLFNAPPGGTDRSRMAAAWDQNARGTAALPGHEAEFRAGVQEALRYAEVLGCPRIHVLSGIVPPGVERESLKDLCVGNLRWAAAEAARAGCDILIEPINLRDMPRYFLNRQDHAHELLDAAQAPNLKVLMDLYHCQIVEGDVAAKLQRYLPTGRWRISRSRACRAATSPTGASCTTRSCSRCWTLWATAAGWGVNTARRPIPRPVWRGGTGRWRGLQRIPRRNCPAPPVRAIA